MGKIDWRKWMFNATCVDLPIQFRNLHNASACLTLIPEELDTPALREIRKFFEKHNIQPMDFYSLQVLM